MHMGRCANELVVRGVCMEIVRRAFDCHCVFNRQCDAIAVKAQCMQCECLESALKAENRQQERSRNAIKTPCKLRSNALVRRLDRPF